MVAEREERAGERPENAAARSSVGGAAGRLMLLMLGVGLSVMIPFLALGEFSLDQQWLKTYGQWAWLAGIVALILDIFVAIPATAIITSLGMEYGPLLGGAIGAVGSFLSGLIAYGLTRLIPQRVVGILLGRHEATARRFVVRCGPLAVACSRFLPLLPETICCVAGLTRMPARSFCLALLCGSVPMSFLYATLPWLISNNGLALLISLLIPVPVWWFTRWLLLRLSADDTAELPPQQSEP